MLIFVSANTISSSKGITAHPMELDVEVIVGAAINIAKFALLGKTVSFDNDFGPSAKGCNEPKNPTTLGPLRRCIEAITLRSKRVG